MTDLSNSPNELTDVVLAYDVRFEVQLCEGHRDAVKDHRDDLPALRDYLVEATACGRCNIVGADYHDDLGDLELDEVLGDTP